MKLEPALYPDLWGCAGRLTGCDCGCGCDGDGNGDCVCLSTFCLSPGPRDPRSRSFDVTRAIGGKVGGREAEAGDGCWASRGDAESLLRGDCWWLCSDDGED